MRRVGRWVRDFLRQGDTGDSGLLKIKRKEGKAVYLWEKKKEGKGAGLCCLMNDIGED